MTEAGGPARVQAALEEIRRRAAEDPAFKYDKFDSFPWAKDGKFQKMFLEKLYTVIQDCPPLVDTAIWQHQLPDITLPLRIERFKEVSKGIEVDGAEYNAYRASNPRPDIKILPNLPEPQFSERTIKAHSVDVKEWTRGLHELHEQRFPQFKPSYTDPDTSQSSAAAVLPSWQTAAPKRELFIDKAAAEHASAAGGKEPYPKLFDDIIEHLTSGKEIPGIRKIPDTVVSDPNISVTGRPAPAKPWEKKRVEEQIANKGL